MILTIIIILLALVIFIAYNQSKGMTCFVQKRPHHTGWRMILSNAIFGLKIQRTHIHATPSELELPFTTHEFTSADGVRLSAWHIPASNPKGLILSFNYLGGCKSELLEHISFFNACGYSVLATDLRGHGNSEGNETTLGWNEYHDITAAWEYAKANLAAQDIIIHGISLSAVAAIKAVAMDKLKPMAMLLECPYDRLINTVRHRVSDFGAPPWPFAHILLTVGGIRQGFNPFRLNPCEHAKTINLPVLIISGKDDPYIKISEINNLASAFTPRAQVEIINGLRHGSAIDHRDEFCKIAGDFLGNLQAYENKGQPE